MIREIKFRIWNMYSKKRYTGLNYSGVKQSIIGGIGFIELLKDTDLVFMQYTGLKDKNGKEIYEGDIIIYNNGIKDIYHLVEYKKHQDSGGYLYIEILGFEDVSYGEVIGNTYENPELLPSK